MQPLYLLDAYGLIYRYYFAFISKPLRNSRGKNISALFGFSRALAGLLAEREPAYLAAVFDSRGPTFRHKLYPEYKATRQKAPEDLHEQVPLVEELLAALGVPVLRKDGFEADDIIATLANRCKQTGRACYIVSSDKDLLQLVGGGVYELRPSKEVGKTYDEIDEEAVKALWGVPAGRILDLLALMGDASDNIPGVKGIGEKTAAKLITRYGSLDDIYQNIAGIEGSVAGKLAQGRESALLSYKLAALEYDVELPASSIEELSVLDLNAEAANAILKREDIREVRFKGGGGGLSSGLTGAVSSGETAAPAPAPAPANGELDDTPLAAALRTLDGHTKWVSATVMEDPSAALIEDLRDFTAHPENRLVSSNIKDVYKMTRRLGFPRWKCFCIDTGVLAWLQQPDGGAGSGAENGEPYEYTPDAPLPEMYVDLEAPLIPILAEMELAGIKLEQTELAAYSVELAAQLDGIKKEVYALAGHEFNISSPKQLQDVLFVERKLKPVKKIKSGFSTDADVLLELSREDPLPALVLRYRTLAKLGSTYVDALPKLVGADGRLHTTFVQTGTATGRLSSRDPNLQNIPVREAEGRRIRAAFTAEPGGMLISADYSQIELAVLAHLSGDTTLRESFLRGEDVHGRTAQLIFGVDKHSVTGEQRRIAKTINFGVMYGMSAFRLAGELGISRTEASLFIESYFKTYAGVRDFMRSLIASAEKAGYVETLFGRRRYIDGINSPNKTVKSAAERMAVNTPIQGTAADIVKRAMLNLDTALSGTRTTMLLQVHDELIFECPASNAAASNAANIAAITATIKTVMETSTTLSVPLRVSVETGTRWGDFH